MSSGRLPALARAAATRVAKFRGGENSTSQLGPSVIWTQDFASFKSPASLNGLQPEGSAAFSPRMRSALLRPRVTMHGVKFPAWLRHPVPAPDVGARPSRPASTTRWLMKLMTTVIMSMASTEALMAARKTGTRMELERLVPSAASAGAGSATLADEAVVSFHRAVDAVMRAFVGLDLPEKRRLKEASDFDVLTTLAARTVQQEGDELAQARLRGLDARKKIVEAVGGFLDGAGVARLLGMTTAAVHKRYKAHQLLGIRQEKRRIVYPAFQLDGERVVRDLPAVLKALSDAGVDEWAQLRFLAGANERLGGRSPMGALMAGEVERVLAAARTFGEHGAA
jgi:hypothetical protein